MKKCGLPTALSLIVLILASSEAFARQDVSQTFVLTRPYIGAALFVPKEGNIDVGYGTVAGIEIASKSEALYIDATFSQTGMNASLPGATRHVRNTVVNAGYKTNFGKLKNWWVGAGLQSQRMAFGGRSMSVLTVAMLAEYKLRNKMSVQLITSQLYKKYGLRFGVFQLNFIKYF